MPSNPWAHSRTERFEDEPIYPTAVSSRYAAPDISEDAPYTDEFGWAPRLRLSPETLPDTGRLGLTPNRDYRPNPIRPPQEFWGILDADEARRHSVETQDADGRIEGKGERRWAPNPRLIPPPEPRPTQQLSPSSYSFVRPFGTGLPKHTLEPFTGEHFSMADHRRSYEVYGMAPQRRLRNTYRLEPAPWDADIVDMPPDTSYPEAKIQAVELPSRSRSWRL